MTKTWHWWCSATLSQTTPPSTQWPCATDEPLFSTFQQPTCHAPFALQPMIFWPYWSQHIPNWIYPAFSLCLLFCPPHIITHHHHHHHNWTKIFLSLSLQKCQGGASLSLFSSHSPERALRNIYFFCFYCLVKEIGRLYSCTYNEHTHKHTEQQLIAQFCDLQSQVTLFSFG